LGLSDTSQKHEAQLTYEKGDRIAAAALRIHPKMKEA